MKEKSIGIVLLTHLGLVDEFLLIHGDPTFSNMLVDEQSKVWLIDPRGYFGSSLLYGDPMYDWAKLYYSVVGNYDSFNRRQFQLKITDKCIDLNIESNGWQDLESICLYSSRIWRTRFGSWCFCASV